MIWAEDGQEYKGIWRSGVQNGDGIATWTGSKPAVYTGEWQNGKRFGKGKMEYSNGSEYNGSWKDDKKSGQAYIKHCTGKLVIAYFENDRIINQPKEINNFHSLTEAELEATLGPELISGKPSVLRNVGYIRMLFQE